MVNTTPALAASTGALDGDAGMLGNLLANFDGLVYRCLIDDSWTMIFMSQGCEALTGYLAEDFLANQVIAYEDVIHPDDRIHVRDGIYAALETNRRFSIEYRIRRRDGTVHWVWERGIGVREGNAYVALDGYIQDITQRKANEHALAEAERRFRSIFENSIEGIFQSTPDKGYLAVNPALARMYGYETPQEMMLNLRHLDRQLYVDPRRRAEFLALMNTQDGVMNFESEVYRRDGSIIWISENARTVRGAASEILFFEGTVIDITQRKLYEERIRHQATHDALTGLPNRNLMHDRLQQAILHASRAGSLAAVAFIDLDQFKFINDSLGHPAGDMLLKIVASRLTSCMRASDTVARQGGDEFVLVLHNHPSEASITDTVQRLLEAVAAPWSANGIELHVTCSIGISIYPNDGLDAETLLRNADAAMYRAKELGRNNFAFFSAEMSVNATERLGMLSRLRNALQRNEFLLHYQPKVCLKTGRLVGAEALLRWHNGSHGPIPPGRFIPLAEESGLIVEIGEWVLRSACRQAVAWQRAGAPPLPIAVNLSPRQLLRDDLLDVVEQALRDTGLDPACLELEITETVIMRDVEKSLHTLHRLKQLGIGIAIDDFGTGYSSLNYLKRLPVDKLKIDRSFVSDITTDPDDAAITRAVISLAHILNLKVVAEGVETEAQHRFLLENGCDEVQGYYFGKPMAHQDFAALLA
ncbi:PAS domain S-box-containing protein/diguanylate cyclase (GGDEF) domain-containing protein [Noviherbaspirillum humi]|uniref:PAS domain S-box-containing protein/diguanylate cyclase (GGDEF) domain-containing protein n=1 Tax=Noviherbaspirillum humi TaxID=1688639 RepID=A0A239C2E2_9BURK|nr:bifunctional diguanylate cyclase/phosphodiesterase [Noviherbaspirillum humi]SNS13801.1 PAS domain S-box-containing protein/diguanylate cyclase (GGDEF) domain-containing protein [Noviherbaspirillum humi]